MNKVFEQINKAAADVAKARAAVARKSKPALEKLLAIGIKFQAQARGEIGRLTAAEDRLLALVKAAESEFFKPKSQTVLDVKFGFRQRADKIVVSDGAVDKIIACLDAERFLRSTVVPNVEALEGLSDEQLAKINCQRVLGENTAFVAADEPLVGGLKLLGVN
jgi:hypothetical protein